MKKLFIIPFLLLFLVAGFSVGIAYQKKQISHEESAITEDQALQKITVNLMFDYGDGQIKTFNEVKVDADETVFDLTKKIAETEKIDFKFKDYGGDMGAFIEAIGGQENDLGKNIFWQYWVNGEYAKAGAGSQTLKDSDAVMWKYVKGQTD